LSSVAFPSTQFNDAGIDSFVEFVRQENYSAILAVGAKSVELLSRHRSRIAPHARLLLPSQQNIETALRKDWTCAFAKNVGVRVPETWDFADRHTAMANVDLLCFPLVVKGRSELDKRAPVYVHSVAGLGAAFDCFADCDFPLLQEYIAGDGVGFFALYVDGECREYFMHRRVREVPPSGGASSCAESVLDDDIRLAGTRLLDALRWHGLAMVEFKRQTNSRDLYLMEINPKLWGSLDLAIASGVNFPTLAVSAAIGGTQSTRASYQVGRRFHWPIDGEIQHLLKRPSSLPAVICDLFNPQVSSNIELDDLGPTIATVRNAFRRAFGALVELTGVLTLLQRASKYGWGPAVSRTLSEVLGVPFVRYSRIDDNVFVGAQHSWLGKERLQALGITATLSLRSEFDDASRDLTVGSYLRVPLAEYDAPSVGQLLSAAKFIDDAIKHGGRIYIHCREGVSRAPLFAAAYYVFSGIEPDDAISAIRKVRPFVNILPNQRRALEEFTQLVSSGGAK
jgi:hypothetical protein